MTNRTITSQIIPLAFTVVVFLSLCALLTVFIHILNAINPGTPITLVLRKRDVLVGLTIYLKTAIDFAIFIGNLMRTNPGWKRRIAIEIGTALGNGLGTLLILVLWNFFREIPILMAVMIFIASLVLLRMAEESLDGIAEKSNRFPSFFKYLLAPLHRYLHFINVFFHPLIRLISPNANLTNIKTMRFFSLLVFSATIPFILGLDDFAGYIPLFSIINVFGFSVGVFLGHMILNAALFVSPKITVKTVRHPIILLAGGVAFIGIAAWGMYEVIHIVYQLLPLTSPHS